MTLVDSSGLRLFYPGSGEGPHVLRQTVNTTHLRTFTADMPAATMRR
jgi:hypothetical protein